MHSLRKNLAKLKRLRKAGPGKRREMLKNADRDLVQCLCECAHNCIYNRLPMTQAQFKQLAKHKQTLRKLSKPGENWKKKKTIIRQSGGFLLPLLGTVFSTLLETFT